MIPIMDMVIDQSETRAVADALAAFQLDESGAWGDLQVLAQSVNVDALELDEDSVVVSESGTYTAIAYVYLALGYGKGDDAFTTSASFRADLSGNINHGVATIEALDIDTSPFYE